MQGPYLLERGSGQLPSAGAVVRVSARQRRPFLLCLAWLGTKEPIVIVRFLDCAPMQPRWPRWDVGGTCIAVETDEGIILVDTDVGLHDHENPC